MQGCRSLALRRTRPSAPACALRRCYSTPPVYAQLHTPTPRVQGMAKNVFAAFSALALQHGAVNLGQGFPSYPCPDFLKEAAAKAIHDNFNQYGRPGGHPVLVQTLAELYSPLFNRNIDAMEEIVTYLGAQEGIVMAMIAFCNRGDEVICIEPFFDAYANGARLAEAKVVGVPLRPKGPNASHNSADWHIDVAELEAAITSRTKILILNTPHNPMGKMLTRAEMEEICQMLERHPHVIVLSDEVYEFTTFDNNEHVRIATLPGMYERTISLYSAGKTFAATGWRVGYSIAPPHLSKPLLTAHAANTFCGAIPLELGVAGAFQHAMKSNYFEELRTSTQARRDRLVAMMRSAGLTPIVPEGGFFTMGDSSRLPIGAEKDDNDPHKDLEHRRDFRAARWLTTEYKITTIPPSGFYLPNHREMANDMLRFCHVRDDATLDKAASNMGRLAQAIGYK